MKAPPGEARTSEALIPAANPVSEKPHSHIPRRWVKDAIRVCLDLGYTVSGAQAWRLIKDYRDWQESDARAFVAAEFRVYLQRRGDLIQPRMKRNYQVGETGWRTAT
jgi:hypothetical protein